MADGYEMRMDALVRAKFSDGPNGERIRVPSHGGWERVYYMANGRSWPTAQHQWQADAARIAKHKVEGGAE